MRVLLLLLLSFSLLSLLLPLASSAIIRKGSKDWKAVDWAKLESDWESSDAPNELETEGDVLHAEIETRRRAASEKGIDVEGLKKMTKKGRKAAVEKMQADTNAGPTMMFANLRPDKAPTGYEAGKECGKDGCWKTDDVEALATGFQVRRHPPTDPPD